MLLLDLKRWRPYVKYFQQVNVVAMPPPSNLGHWECGTGELPLGGGAVIATGTDMGSESRKVVTIQSAIVCVTIQAWFRKLRAGEWHIGGAPKPWMWESTKVA